MLMTAARGLDLGHSPSPSTSPAPAWLPVVLADDSNNRHHQLLCHFVPTPTPATATAAPPNHHNRPARRVAKRRPRPSRKMPTTYITADPASFRRMVHQVTGADDLPFSVMPPSPAPETLCRPAPYRSGTAPASAMMLPTLDTSAFLVGAPGVPAPAAPALDQMEAGGAGGACNYSSNSGSNSSCGGGFPTLDSWDALL